MALCMCNQLSLDGDKYTYGTSFVRLRGRQELTSYSSLHRSIVTIYVSAERYPHYFHKGWLYRRPSFFEKAFQGSFEEATTGSMYLEEDGADECKVSGEWLYS